MTERSITRPAPQIEILKIQNMVDLVGGDDRNLEHEGVHEEHANGPGGSQDQRA